MASLALSVVGTAIGGPIGGMIGGMVGGLIDNILFPAPSTPPPPITTSTYGKPIPQCYGEQVRLGCNMIFTSGWRKAKIVKSAKSYLSPVKALSAMGQPPAYVADFACAVMAGPVDPDWIIKIFANGSVIFDSTLALTRPTPDANGVVTWLTDVGSPNPHGTQKDFASLVVYPGNNLQEPDPTIESYLGAGQAQAYRGTAYFVINGLQGTNFGNSIPVLQILAQPNKTGIKLNQVVNDIVARAGLDPTLVSTSALSAPVMGYVIDGQTDGVTALQPLALVFNFDVAEVAGSLRFSPRGEQPIATVISDQLAGHEYGGARPSFQWPDEPTITLPKVAAFTFIDPARDCQENTQSARRATGSSQNLMSASCKITMSSAVGRQVADRLLWEAVIGRQTFVAAADDRVGFLEAARTYAFEVPFGYETVRITKRTRGANGVIEIEGKRDAPAIYVSAAPSADANSAPNLLGLGGPVNPPIFIEPPSGFPGLTGAQLFIALSGGEAGVANPAWGGCQVYVATDDVDGDYVLAGSQIGPSTMGQTSKALPTYGGNNPDVNTVTGHVLQVDTSESGGEPLQQTFLDAQLGQTVLKVGGEFMAGQHVNAVGGDVYNITDLWRGLYGSPRLNHSIGEDFVQIDAGIFRLSLASAYIGVPLFFRFVSAGEQLTNVTTYTYTPAGVVAATDGSTQQITASENLTAGELVNLWSDAGALAIRKADATDDTKPANGFVKVAVTSGDVGVFFTDGQQDAGFSGLTPGATYYLAVGGGITVTPPAVSGNGLQSVGVAMSATTLLYQGGAMTAVP